MIHFKSQNLSKKQQYKFLSGSVIPRPIAWVTTRSEEHLIVNAAPFSFFSGVSNQIPLLSLAIMRNEGKMKDTAKNIIENQELVIHFVSEALVNEMNATAASISADESELEKLKLHLVESQSVKVKGIAEALVRFEAVLYQHIPIKDENHQTITDLLLVKITDFYFDESIFDQDKEYILAQELAPLARLAGNQYGSIKDIFEVERPE